MKYFLYDILAHTAFVATLPYYFFKALTTDKYREGAAERFGLVSAGKVNRISGAGGPVLWVHAVSVGETKAVIPLLKRLRGTYPGAKILFSTTTLTGQRVAEREGGGLFDALIYFPLDFSWAVKRVIKKFAPDIFIVVEKEVWPNLYNVLSRRSVPIVVVNGTISERSFKRFARFRRFFLPVFSQVAYFCARTEDDLERAVSLGVGRDRAGLTGNMKFDLNAQVDKEKIEDLKRALNIRAGERVIVAGSTHKGEEEIFLDVFKKLLEEFKGLKLVLAPRHPERFSEVEALIKAAGLTCSRRSAASGTTGSGDVVLLDTIGELMAVYSLSEAAFVGGSLVQGVGGHNLLEPAAFGKPVLYGPYLSTYLSMAEMLEEEGGGIRVKDGGELLKKLKKLLSDKDLRLNTGSAGKRVVDRNRGAVDRTLKVIDGLLR
ncbi:MAG: 3-deoxy-D-manno-octulosonic acid transferase [Thermodesulfobacteriota bacterium]|nr:MAG: 3-deoxy-D-manno-octulosonic acid transferase [Thermodesulfobacteriota bacterium]